jgi:hypothetical protein
MTSIFLKMHPASISVQFGTDTFRIEIVNSKIETYLIQADEIFR